MTARQDTLGFLVVEVSRLFRRAFRQRLEGSGLTHAQARTLVYLSRHEGVRQVELAELLDVQPITLARLIDQLAAAGLVERRPDPVDRRAHRVYLLPAAEPHLDVIDAVAAGVRARALRDLDEEQAAIAHAVLRRMRENLSSS